MSKYTRFLFLVIADFAAITHAAEDSSKTSAFVVPEPVQEILGNYCTDCHGSKKSKGEVRLHEIATLDSNIRIDLISKMQEQLHFTAMPPEDEDLPTPAESKLLEDWVRGELTKSNAPQIEDKLRYPDYGNSVDHKKLFSGEIKEKPYTPARRWLVSPQIFKERVIEVFNLKEKEREILSGKIQLLINNPFILPDNSGVQYYDITPLSGGHLLSMLTTADWISNRQISAALIKQGVYEKGNRKTESFMPETTPAVFEAIILKNEKPGDDEIHAAIQEQFDCVLRRPASDKELVRYTEVTRAAIALAGNTEGLRRMLVAVLLESEFLYRYEFGAGPVDTSGRKMLSPREASYAISYALGDRGPDPALVKAAQDGRLSTKEDYRREVLRLLSDKEYYAGTTEERIGRHDSPWQTPHPRTLRFFRDFFGYPNALSVFKDTQRTDGVYGNTSAEGYATPGRLVREADELVDWYVQKDKNVFENLLTTDQIFLYRGRSETQDAKRISEWRELYKALKDTDWKNDPKKVGEAHAALLKKNRVDAVKTKNGSYLPEVMEYFSHTFGKGIEPFPQFPWASGFAGFTNYGVFYGLPKMPGQSYTPDKHHKRLYLEADNLSYPIAQPFKASNHVGILTHPAWLIAHSGNAHTDPIRRGRWIREKLLAGRVPDVPITVNAIVPEDPHRTFRERVESVTGPEQGACWKCHQHMNPLGFPFEKFDDFGRFRAEEPLEYPENVIKEGRGISGGDTYKTKTVNTTGVLDGTGDMKLDGPVTDSFDLISRLAKSEQARQSIIRHAFRFYMGRNELLSDSETLIAADKAYVESGGSFKAVIVSLLTSDSFMYRK